MSLDLPYTEFNARYHSLILFSSNGDRFSFDDKLSFYRLDENELNSHPYMTRNVFSAGARKINGEDMFYLLLNYIDDPKHNWQYYGGLITNVCFRIAENIEYRSKFIPYILEKYLSYAKNAEISADHSVRWYLSGSLNIAILLLYIGDISNSKKVIDIFLSRSIPNGAFPLTYMNLATMLFLRSAIALEDGDISAAYLLALECADCCQNSLPKLFTARNRYYFQHRYDAEQLLRIGYASSLVANSLGNRTNPMDSILEYPRRKYDNIAKYDMVAHRFIQPTGGLPPLILSVNKKILDISKDLV